MDKACIHTFIQAWQWIPVIAGALCTSMVNRSTWQWRFTTTLPSAFFWVETNARKWKIISPAKDPGSMCKYILNKRPYLWSHDLHRWSERLVLREAWHSGEVYGSWSQTCSCIQSPLTPLSRHDVCLRQVIQLKSRLSTESWEWLRILTHGIAVIVKRDRHKREQGLRIEQHSKNAVLAISLLWEAKRILR